jgi:hypothetical protein
MNNMKTTALLINLLADYGITTACYYDRLTIYFDGMTSEEDLALILKDNPNNKFLRQSLPHNDHFDRKIELFNPSDRCLLQLANLDRVKSDCAITYIEFSIDFMTNNLRAHNKFGRFLKLHLLHIPSNKSANSAQHHNINGETVYFSAKEDKKRFVMYSDKSPRKGSLKKCHHLEYRVSGWAEVKKQKIITIKNLIDFDHEMLWDSLLDLRRPNLAMLGEISGNRSVSRQANHKRGVKVWASIDSIQEHIKNHAEREPAFIKMTPESLGKWLNAAFKAKQAA